MENIIKSARSIGATFFIRAATGFLLAGAAMPSFALADDQPVSIADSDLKAILQQLKDQGRQIAAQQRALREQQRTIDALKQQMQGNQAPVQNAETSPLPNAKPAHTASAAVASPDAERSTQTVGEKPVQADRPPDVPTIATMGGILTHRGTLIIEPFAQYSRSTANNFTFEGVEIVDAFLIGLINAGRNSNDVITAGATARYGITDRLEFEARVPYVYRDSRFEGTILNSNNSSIIQQSSGSGLGDLEFALHYQLNDGQDDWPFFIGNLRYKTNTGVGPFDIAYNSDGSSKSLPTGSGFSAIEPSVTAIYPSDPAVLFANIGWIHNFGSKVNTNLLGGTIKSVEPGDTFSGTFGMGVALNDRLSFTLGYEHDYIRPTTENLISGTQHTDALQVGQLLLGMSFKVNNRTAVNLELAAGVTRDAPDMQLTLRVPLSFDVCSDVAIFCR